MTHPDTINIVHTSFPFERFFDSAESTFFSDLERAARRLGMKVGVVGGPVRDLLLGLRMRELDLIVEGNAIDFVRALVDGWKSFFPNMPPPRIAGAFERYGTVKIRSEQPYFGSASEIDFASARKEIYPRPGRAPEVEYPCRMEEDIARRDFSINALALVLLTGDQVELVDSFHGCADLQAKLLRVLHDQSFCDDPARLLRAIRFQVRFGLSFEPHTLNHFLRAVQSGNLATLTPQRRFDEFRKALAEERFVPVLRRLDETSLLAQVHPACRIDEPVLSKMEKLPTGESKLAGILGSLLSELGEKDYERQLKEWGLSKKQASEFIRVRSHVV